MKRPVTTRDKIGRGVTMVRRGLSFWRRALLVFVITALGSVPYSLTVPRAYKSEAVVLYQETIRSTDLTGATGEGLPDTARRLGARLREAVTSRASLAPIVLDLHLYPRVVEQRGLVDAVDEMRKHITFRAREGDTFEVAFEGTTPDEVQEVTQRLAGSIVKEAAVRRAERARTLKEFVDAESERTNAELKVKEGALASFLADHPEFKRRAGSDLLAMPLPPSSEALPLASLEQRAARIERELAAAPASRPGAVLAPRPLEPSPDTPEVVAARRDLLDKLTRYTERHPDVLDARARLHAAESAQSAQAARAAQRAANEELPEAREGRSIAGDEKESLRRQLAALQAQIAARRARPGASASTVAATVVETQAPAQPASAPAPIGSSGSVDLEVAFRRLQREVYDARERQRQLDETQFKVSIAASSVMNDRNVQVSVLDAAYRPTHAISRPRSVLVGAALLLCLVLALLTAGVSAWFDDRIHDRAPLERLEVLPLLAVIPRAALPASRKGRPHG